MQIRVKNNSTKKVRKHRRLVNFSKASDAIIICTIIFYFLVLIFQAFVGEVGFIEGASMLPSYKDKEIFISLDQNSYNRFDTIIGISNEDEKIIKRVLGTPGDSIEIKDNILYVNEIQIEEFYVKQDTLMQDMDEVELGENDYFIMGDNRNNSKDSRFYGKVDKSQLESKVIATIDIPFLTK